MGIAKHDDIAFTILNLSRIFDELEYTDWLYDFLDTMEDSKQDSSHFTTRSKQSSYIFLLKLSQKTVIL